MEQGAVADMVAASLGHTSFVTTARHYAAPQAIHHAQTERVLAVLGSDGVSLAPAPGSPPPIMNEPAPRLPALSAAPISISRLEGNIEQELKPDSSPLAWVSRFQQRKPPRVLGPYKSGNHYRLVVLYGPERRSLTRATREEAEALRAEMASAIAKTLPERDDGTVK